MKTYFYLTFILYFTIIHLFAQEAPKVRYGKPDIEDLKMKTYLPDTTADAVILYDEGQSEVKYDLTKETFMLTFERFVRIKILKQAGTDWGTFKIPIYSFNASKEEIMGINGITFNLEGEKSVKSEMKKDAVFQERENKYWESAKFSLPSVKVGSVIDLKYTIHSPFLWNLQTWTFQYSIPVKWSQYEVVYPEYFDYNHSTMGYHMLNSRDQKTQNENINYVTHEDRSVNGLNVPVQRAQENRTISYLTNIYNYTAKDVPAIKEEPFLTTIENYTTKLKLELSNTNFTKIGGNFKNYTTSWNDIVKQLIDDPDFGGQIKPGNFVKETVEKLIAGKISEKDKAFAIYDFVQHNIKWNDSKTYMPSKPLRKILDEKIGNSVEINLILLSMLQKAGISADPVILSTRDHGIISPVHASLSDCNYIIVRTTINDKPVFMDATEPNLPAGLLPYRCLNGKGIVIKTDSAEEIELANAPSVNNTMANLEIKQGKLTGKILNRLAGLDAFNFRQEVKKAGGQDAQFKLLKEKAEGIEYLNYSYTNLDSLYAPISKTYDVNIELNGDEDASILYIYPMVTERMTKNPFTTLTREYPVDFGVPYNETYKLNLVIPDGYQVEELPKSKSIVLDDKVGIFTYQIAQMDKRVVLNMRLSILKSLFLPSEYSNLKSFFDLIVAKEAEQIVLKKIVTP
jgi:hypothetical protein